MLLDDLDFLLLDLAAEFKLSLDWFLADVGLVFNRRVPPYTLDELKLAFVELFGRGDAVASIAKPHSRRQSRTFVPTPDEVEAGLRGAVDLVYELTLQGGARWEAAVQADWSQYLSWSQGRRFRWSEAQSREYLEYQMEVDRAYRRIEGAPRWKEFRPWRPVYWKLLPQGYQVRCRRAKENSSASGCCWPSSLPPWSLGYTPEFHHGPPNLAPRKQRSEAQDPPEKTAPRPVEKLWRVVESGRQERKSFAAACEWAPQAATEALLRQLRFRRGLARFAAVRELIRRRETGAVSELAAMALNQRYLPALWALGEITDERGLRVLEMLLEYGDESGATWHGTLVRAIAGHGDHALPGLAKALRSTEYAFKSGAISVLGLIQSEASRPLLESALAEEPARGPWSRKIERALGRQTERRWPEKLTQDRLWRVSLVIAGACNAPPPADPIQALAAALTHSDSARRGGAVDLLVEFGARDRLPEIERLAKDPAWQVRASVAHALQQLGGSRRLLAALAKDLSPTVRWLARKPILPRIV